MKDFHEIPTIESALKYIKNGDDGNLSLRISSYRTYNEDVGYEMDFNVDEQGEYRHHTSNHTQIKLIAKGGLNNLIRGHIKALSKEFLGILEKVEGTKCPRASYLFCEVSMRRSIEKERDETKINLEHCGSKDCKMSSIIKGIQKDRNPSG